MSFHIANAVDILRCSQKDEQFTDLYAGYLSEIIRLCGKKYRYKFTKIIHPLSLFLYYGLTSLSKLQTLGEEYTGILRFIKSKNNIPDTWIHIIWLLFFIGGNNLFDNSLNHIEKKLKSNKNLTLHARTTLLNFVNFFTNNKVLLIRINQNLFYINGKYYNISNRLTGIQYVFLRRWMGNDNYSKAFTILGRISTLYFICAILNKLYNHSYKQSLESTNEIAQNFNSSAEECFLCAEIKANPTALSCGHIFCWKCIFNSLEHRLKCPICREPAHPSRIILLQNY